MLKKWLFQEGHKYFFRMFEFMRPDLFKFIFTGIIYSSQGFVFPLMLAIFTGGIMESVHLGDADGMTRAGSNLAIMFIGYFMVFGTAIYFNMTTVLKAELRLKQKLYRMFTSVGVEDAKHSGEGIASLNTDTNTAISIFGSPLMFLINRLLIIPAAITVVFIVEWRLGLSLLFIGSLSFALGYRFTKPLAEIGKEWLEENAESVKTASNIFSGAITIRAYNMQPNALVSFDVHNRRLKLLDIRRAIISLWQHTIGTIEGWLTLVVTFGFGGYLVATGQMEFHLLALVYIMGRLMASAIGGLGRLYADLQPPIAAAKRVFLAMETVGDVAPKARGEDFTSNETHRLSLRDFSFRYLGTDKDVLRGINLDIAENTMVAFVGESGSGKSTLLGAIIGMYVRDKLNISLGGVAYNDASLEDWRKKFAYVDQSCKLFDMSVRENIAMGLGGAATEEEIREAAMKAAAHGFIMEFENGYDTPCGEMGSTVSGGQKQRIAIARALIRKAPIVVFDEATGSLDKDTERQIMDTVESLRKEHTVLITTHNLDTITTADKIVVLDGGEIVETGTHEELMAKGGVYFGLYAKGQVRG